LPIGIQEEIIQTSVQVVVMGNVPRSTPSGVSLMQKADRSTNALMRPCHAGWEPPSKIGCDESEDVIDGAARYDEPAFHVKLAECEHRIEQKSPLCWLIAKSNGERILRAIADHEPSSRCGLHFQRAASHDVIQELPKKYAHLSTPS
jgi:hypothetical protein